MSTKDTNFIFFLKEILRRHKQLPSQLAADIGISHVTVMRWLSGTDIPSTSSCRKLAEYSGLPIEDVFAAAGHLPEISKKEPHRWPEFREYAQEKYPNELDEDIITMIEDLIERRRAKKYAQKRKRLGK